MAYISFVLQRVLHPDTLYKLVMYHRLTIIVVAFLFDLLLVYRFRFIGLGFAVIFELTKYYLFGSTFLAESIVVYPLVYLAGLAWEVLQKRRIASWEIWLGSLFTFFVIFMREPYIPTAIGLFVILLTTKQSMKLKLGAVVLCLLLSVLIIISLPIRSYFYELVTVNFSVVASSEIQSTHLNGPGIITIFIYPLIILVYGLIDYFRGVLVLIDLLFLIAFYLFAFSEKQWKKGLVLLFILGISNIRITEPGTAFYGAYHMLVWYGLFIFFTLLLVKNIYTIKHREVYHIVASILLLISFLYLILPANSLLWDKFDRQLTFNTNYGLFYSDGEVVRDLANNQTTFFVDGWDSLMYWQADVPLSYPYLFFYPPMKSIPVYTDARTEMFKKNPPEFVYSYCKLSRNKLFTNSFIENSSGAYKTFYYAGNPTCLYIRKSATKTITSAQWDQMKQFGYYLK